MEEWSYEQVKQYVSESFDGFLECDQPIEKATSSVIYEYEDIIDRNPKEGVMIYTAIFKYLNNTGEKFGWFDTLVSEAYDKFSADEKLESSLEQDILEVKVNIEE